MRAEQIRERLLTCGIPCDESLAEKLSIYMSLLTEWNTRMDLTAVTEEEETLDRHFKDSLLPVAISGLIPVDGSAIDVGTGAGFPGLPLAMAMPSLRVTLLDSQVTVHLAPGGGCVLVLE